MRQRSQQSSSQHWFSDFTAGFVVFLVALPLSLGISMASGFPPFAGLLAAALGGILVSRINGSHVTINGPAAGLIVIVLGGVETLGAGDAWQGYRMTLAAIVVAGAILAIAGRLRGGALSQYFPISAIHGMLSAIGVIIISKQIHTALGVTPQGKAPLALLAETVKSFGLLNPEIAVISAASFALLLGVPRLPLAWAKRIPAPMLVVLVGVFLGHAFDLEHQHKYLFLNSHEYAIGPRFLVTLPSSILSGITFPLWKGLGLWAFWKLTLTLAIVQGLESLLSAAAVDSIDPFKRKTDLNKDLTGVGVGSLVSGFLGGLPMIAEIVRSQTNVLNGARTGWANFFHGILMAAFVLLFPDLIHQIPLASLACILIVTGYRLASPSQFSHAWKVGSDQFAVFVSTLLVTLATDLLFGVVAGLVLEALLVSLRAGGLRLTLRSPVRAVAHSESQSTVRLGGTLSFLNYRALASALQSTQGKRKVILDFADCRGIDHTAVGRLEEWILDQERLGRQISRRGWEELQPSTEHTHASRWIA